jgi:hypothetical protein
LIRQNMFRIIEVEAERSEMCGEHMEQQQQQWGRVRGNKAENIPSQVFACG